MLKLAPSFTNRLRARLRQASNEDTAERDAEFARCKADVGYFIHNYLIIDKAQDDDPDTTGTMPFHLWAAQREALEFLVSEQRVVFLKARQLGISWLCLAYALWLALFHNGKLCLLFSQTGREAAKMLTRVQSMYDRLPAWMHRRLPRRIVNNTTTQSWSNGSSCMCLPATKKAGNSFTASLAIMDEAAHLEWGDKLYAALGPTIDGGGKLFVVSSANGADGFFDKLWKKAESGLSTFKTIFLPWTARPGRDQAWYGKVEATYSDPELMKQNYPANSLEAFLASGRSRFPSVWIAAQRARATSPVRPEDYEYHVGMSGFPGLTVWELPRPDRTYIVSADPAEGKADGDASDCTVFCRESLCEVAAFNGKFDADIFANYIADIARFYNSKVLVERNNHGHAVLLRLGDLCPDRILEGLDGARGWVTSTTTKHLAVDEMASHLRDGTITIRSAEALDEFDTFQVQDNGTTSASSGAHDDRVMSRVIMVGWLKLALPSSANPPLRKAGSPLAGWRG